jgi:hypothetical protein
VRSCLSSSFPQNWGMPSEVLVPLSSTIQDVRNLFS